MPKSHYTRSDLVEALRAAGLRRGDIAFSHSHIGFFGIPEGAPNPKAACSLILDALLEVLGDSGTLVVPTFTYSFPAGMTFDTDLTHSDCGVFTEFVRTHEAAYRSIDPCVSVAAIGADAKELTRAVPSNAYGRDSFFERFFAADGKICNLNFDAGSTFVHFVERELEIPYRFDKTFSGTIRANGVTRSATSTIWVRYVSSVDTTAEFEALDELARTQGLFQTATVGRGQVGVITAAATFELIERTLPERPWFLTRAELTGRQPVLKLEPTTA
jgi:aminoglycoside 3-N-acetyltransferase|tara:strand:- start:423 stop:1241 length:819 start_codon:yes stop_codon:yes gene_type:complete